MERRKKLFVKKKFQLSFILKFALLLLLESVLIVFLFTYMTNNTVTTGYAQSILRVESSLQFFLVPFILLSMICFVAISLVGMVVFTLFSHRIAGPLYRFEKILQQMGEGDLTANVNLRKKDQLVEVETLINEFVDMLDKRMGAMKVNLEQAQAFLMQMEDSATREELCQKLNLIKDEINHFKVTSDFKTK